MSKKKEEELQAIKDVSRPAIDAVSMKQPKDQTDEEWQGVKAKAKAEGRNVSDAEYETRYQALLKRYNIKPENYETSSGGAVTYYEEGKKDSQSEKQGKAPSEQKKAPTEQKKAQSTPNKPSSKPTKSKSSTKSNTASKGTKTPPPQSTGRAQTSKTGSNIPPKKGYPKGGYKEENQDVEGINGNAVKTMLYNDRVKLKSRNGRPAKESFKPAETTLASIRSEYQKNLIAKHKKEVADIRADDIRYGGSPLTIQAQQTKKKSPLDINLDKEKKKFKYKQ